MKYQSLKKRLKSITSRLVPEIEIICIDVWGSRDDREKDQPYRIEIPVKKAGKI